MTLWFFIYDRALVLYCCLLYCSQAEKEPILSSFLYASVLSHDCLERALSFVLANRLEDPTLLATQLIDIFNDVMMNNKDIRRSIRLDAQVSIVIVLFCGCTMFV